MALVRLKERLGAALENFRVGLRQLFCSHKHTVQERVFSGGRPLFQARCLICGKAKQRAARGVMA